MVGKTVIRVSMPGQGQDSFAYPIPDLYKTTGTMNSKVWLITGAGRGLGADIAKAALRAGHKVVATGRNTGRVSKALGKAENLLVLPLDVTNQEEAEEAVKASVEQFGAIDVLVNNAGAFYAGNFEELSPAQMQSQLDINLMGPMNVTRA